MSGGAWAAVAIASCALWWLYLVGSSAMVVRFDASDYNALGEMLHRQGWREFLRTGPHREPLYPLLVAAALRAGELVSLPYQKVLAGLQFGLIVLTQLLMLRLAALMGIRKRLAAAAVVTFGFSPAIVNSACSMFSEVLSYPFVVLAALLTARAWETVKEGRVRPAVVLALATAAVLAAGAFTKGVLHYVSLLVAMLFGVRAVWTWNRGRRSTAVAALAFALTNLVLGQAVVHWYKDLNRRHNGNYEFTTRYVGILYGNAAKRAMPMTTRQLLAHVAAIPGNGACRMLFTEEECRFCESGTANELWLNELPRRLEHVPEPEKRAATLRLFGEKVLASPLQYAFVGMTQALRMPFWESTRIGYVAYPPWLDRVYSAGIVKNGLRLLVGLLTFFALVWAGARLVLPATSRHGGRTLSPPCAMVFFVAASFMLLHTPFSVLTRYALPIAPLYLLLVAAMLDDGLDRRRTTVGDARPAAPTVTPLP